MTISSPVQDYLDSLLERFTPLTDGRVADYIPELFKARPEWFGIAVATRDGYLYQAGETEIPFTIQSISKALAYGIALEDKGREIVLSKVGVEPSGDAFNAISLNPATGSPMNPMINAGAIAICGLIEGDTAEEKIGRILDVFSRYTGRQLDIDETVYHSESDTGHRNRAIGWMLRNFDILDGDPTPTLETYFQQCSIRVTCRDLAMIGATLANGGVNPQTGIRALAREYVEKVLSVMATCGMYDASGEWTYSVGLPAKSGVGGGILSVLPGQLGVGVFSPPLDAQGNSVRAVAVCRELSNGLGLHLLDVSTPPATAIRLATDRRHISSKRGRTEKQAEFFRREGQRIRLYQLQGDLSFARVEPLLRAISDHAATTDAFVVNLAAVTQLSTVAAKMLLKLGVSLHESGKLLIFSHAGPHQRMLRDTSAPPGWFFKDDDYALENCEEFVLARHSPAEAEVDALPLAKADLAARLSESEIAIIEGMLLTRNYKPGEIIIHKGHDAHELFVLTQGRVTVGIETRSGPVRLDVFAPGMTFGEIAFLDQAVRSADVVADEPVVCRILTREAFDRLETEAPSLKIKLLGNIARGLAANLREANAQLSVLR